LAFFSLLDSVFGKKEKGQKKVKIGKGKKKIVLVGSLVESLFEFWDCGFLWSLGLEEESRGEIVYGAGDWKYGGD
jgi:hypothetical protein